MMSKHVQAEVPESTYEALALRARRDGLSLKAVVRDAIEEYLRQAPDGPDPLLGIVGSGTLPGTDHSVRKDWRA